LFLESLWILKRPWRSYSRIVPEETPVRDDATRIVYTGCMSVLCVSMTLKLSDLAGETLDKRVKVYCRDCCQVNCDDCCRCADDTGGVEEGHIFLMNQLGKYD